MKSPASASAMPSLLVAATGSGAGKTLTTLALLCALRRRGIGVVAAKSGPDYIDAGFHAAVTGLPAVNLDVWMSREAKPGGPQRAVPQGLARLFSRLCASGDVVVTEGAMGLFDGAADGSAGGSGSAAHLAALLRLPVLLLIHAGGLGQSVAALAEGFLRHRPALFARCGLELTFAGLVCTHVGGEKHQSILRSALQGVEAELGVPLLGLLPREGAPRLASRHLGLVEAREAASALDQRALAAWLEANCDIDVLLSRIGFDRSRCGAMGAGNGCGRGRNPLSPLSPNGASESENTPERPVRRRCSVVGVRVGIARDAAFSFCYADLPDLLAEFGAQCVFFSPLADAAPPECEALYFPGGYPELHARELAANTEMLAAVRRLAARNTPVYGECGGYIYLMRSLRYDGADHAFSGLLPLDCVLGGNRAALGYRAVRSFDGLFWARGHEFHYGRIVDAEHQGDCFPHWRMYDSAGADLGIEGCRRGSVSGSWVHLYPEGARRFWKTWLHWAAEARNGRQRRGT